MSIYIQKIMSDINVLMKYWQFKNNVKPHELISSFILHYFQD